MYQNKTNLSEIIHIYKEQLEKFYRLGIGNMTEHRTIVTDRLIDATKRRLNELQHKKLHMVRGLSNNGIKWLSLCSIYVY